MRPGYDTGNGSQTLGSGICGLVTSIGIKEGQQGRGGEGGEGERGEIESGRDRKGARRETSLFSNPPGSWLRVKGE
jgi:hypothetical protein